MSRPTSIALLPVLLLSACAVGPRYQPPVSPAAGPLVASGDLPEAPPRAWWRLYGDPALDRLVEQAIAENRDLRTAEANLRQAKAAVDAAAAPLVPTLGLSSGPAWGRSPGDSAEAAAIGRDVSPDWTWSESASLGRALDLFGGTRRSIEAARADAEASAYARDLVRITVEASTVRAYLDACASKAEIQSARRAVAISVETVERTASLENQGGAKALDLARARALEAQARAALPPLEAQRRAATLELAALIGRANGAVAEVETCEARPRLASPTLPVGDSAAFLKRRPDVRQAERRLAAETARIGVATAELYPSVSISASFSAAASRPASLGAPSALTWGLGPLVSWSFPNPAARAQVKAARASASAALSSFDEATLTALKDARQAIAAWTGERARGEALAMQRDQDLRAFEIAKAEIDAGGISQLDLLQAEADLIAAELSLAASDQTLGEDEVSVFRALGAG